MGPQFYHFQSFSRKANPAGQSVAQILAEARRQGEYVTHVEAPRPPVLRWGAGLDELAKAHDAMVEAASTVVRRPDGVVRQKRIRRDRHTLGAAVASYPLPRARIEADESGEERARYERWVALNLAFFRNQFGDQLKTVIEHVDEEFAHLHAFALPDHRADVDARSFNPAFAEKRRVEGALKAEGVAPKLALRAANLAYRKVARSMVDAYYQAVGQPAGLTREGPRRARLSRAEWKRQKLDARAASDLSLHAARTAVEKVQATRDTLAAEAETARARIQAAAEAEATAQAEVSRAEADIAKVGADRAALIEERAAFEAEADAKAVELAELEDDLDAAVADLTAGQLDLPAEVERRVQVERRRLEAERNRLRLVLRSEVEGELAATRAEATAREAALRRDEARASEARAAIARERDAVAAERSALARAWDDLAAQKAAVAEQAKRVAQDARAAVEVAVRTVVGVVLGTTRSRGVDAFDVPQRDRREIDRLGIGAVLGDAVARVARFWTEARGQLNEQRLDAARRAAQDAAKDRGPRGSSGGMEP